MKKLIFICLIFCSFKQVLAQYPKEGDIVVDNNIDKYVGQWTWNKGNRTENLTIYLYKEKVKLNPNISYDMLVGYHTYTKGEKIIENTYADKQTNYTKYEL